ncbi:MAG: ABC transporter ATP-binding protein [Alistipes sp.]
MITLKNVSYGYRRRQKVLSEITLSFDEGHIHGLLGCNGVGKSTLLKLICGLLTPHTGQIAVNGADPQTHSVQMLSQLFFVPEEISLPALSIRRFAHITAPFYPNFSVADFNSYCAALEVDDSVRLDKLSMGQRKKAYIAFALACNTPLLLLDEPTNGLDIPSKGVFRRLLSAYTTPERTVIIATHQVKELERLIDQVVICDTQGIVLNTTVDRLSQRMLFGRLPQGVTPLYSEASLAGEIGVARNTTNNDSALDLELLFNATVRHRDEIASILNDKNTSDHE